MHYPFVDPIPVPAPIWLMKLLGLLTLATHFVAVQILIGSLVAILWFTSRGASTGSAADKQAASVVARRVTIVMTYVINLGIPPLLFTQVLYGRALYTSSDLIGALWIAVIPLLMVTYRVLYGIVEQTKKGESAVIRTVISLILVAIIGRIYSYNMTLMIRPEVWQGMYGHSASGIYPPPADAISIFRWAYIVLGSLMTGGLWLSLHSGLSTIEDGTKAALRKVGGAFALIGGLIQIGAGLMVVMNQAPEVHADLVGGLYFHIAAGVWAAGLLLALLFGGIGSLIGKGFNLVRASIACLGGFLGLCGAVCVRDAIRDATLKAADFNVWDRVVYPNWWVLGIFFFLFVITLGVIGWLLWVMKIAKPIPEQVAS